MKIKNFYHSFANLYKIWFFCTALFGYGIIASLVTDASNSRLLTLPYRVIILGNSILFCIFLILKNLSVTQHDRSPRKNLRTTQELLIFILFIFLASLSFRLIYDVGYNNVLTKEPSEYLLNWFGICLIPATTFLFLDFKKSQKYLYLSWVFLAVASSLVIPGVLQGQVSRVFIEQGRLAGEALNPISLGHQGGSLLLISLYILLNKKYFKNKRDTILYILFLILGLGLLIFAASRGPIIAITLCVILLLISVQKKGVNILKVFSIMIIVMIFANISLSLALDSGSNIVERFSSIANDFDSSRFVQRPELYRTAIELIAEYPIFGYALEIPVLGYPHNLILEAFLATGLLGGFLFLLLYVYAGIKALRIIMDENNSWGWLGLIYIQYAIAAMLSGALYSSYTFWYLFFAIIGLKKLNTAYLESKV
ncbi:O-antigen ligase family protein [Nodularia sp. NIES-3585]|uniref:O-antigen ligase family protein n=1 Tax=Nodularia sp. NIES-3585 TaxID=1973477 RepID=UPI000B5C4407|nr:O-antigen ligase family protein [Nodularia sp. NIES-3585]GAX36707.1 hypothetical protein NIES3585_27440 [Nodularia sp. NIES-3585]